MRRAAFAVMFDRKHRSRSAIFQLQKTLVRVCFVVRGADRIVESRTDFLAAFELEAGQTPFDRHLVYVTSGGQKIIDDGQSQK